MKFTLLKDTFYYFEYSLVIYCRVINWVTKLVFDITRELIIGSERS